MIESRLRLVLKSSYCVIQSVREKVKTFRSRGWGRPTLFTRGSAMRRAFSTRRVARKGHGSFACAARLADAEESGSVMWAAAAATAKYEAMRDGGEPYLGRGAGSRGNGQKPLGGPRVRACARGRARIGGGGDGRG